jgi:serralysin
MSSAVAGDQAFSTATGAFTGHARELVLTYDSGTGKTTLKGDCDGDSVADFVIEIIGNHATYAAFVY